MASIRAWKQSCALNFLLWSLFAAAIQVQSNYDWIQLTPVLLFGLGSSFISILFFYNKTIYFLLFSLVFCPWLYFLMQLLPYNLKICFIFSIGLVVSQATAPILARENNITAQAIFICHMLYSPLIATILENSQFQFGWFNILMVTSQLVLNNLSNKFFFLKVITCTLWTRVARSSWNQERQFQRAKNRIYVFNLILIASLFGVYYGFNLETNLNLQCYINGTCSSEKNEIEFPNEKYEETIQNTTEDIKIEQEKEKIKREQEKLEEQERNKKDKLIQSCSKKCKYGNCEFMDEKDKLPICNCREHWRGNDCTIPICNSNCSNHGICSDETDPPVCICELDFSGFSWNNDCSRKPLDVDKLIISICGAFLGSFVFLKSFESFLRYLNK